MPRKPTLWTLQVMPQQVEAAGVALLTSKPVSAAQALGLSAIGLATTYLAASRWLWNQTFGRWMNSVLFQDICERAAGERRRTFQAALAFSAAAVMCGQNLFTVSSPGLQVVPSLIFHSVVNGTPDTSARRCSWACPSGDNRSRTTAVEGI